MEWIDKTFMNKIIHAVLLLAVLPTMVYAGEGTIRETDKQIVIEYSGENDKDVIDAKIVRAQEEKKQEKKDEMIRILAENEALLREKRLERDAAKNADK